MLFYIYFLMFFTMPISIISSQKEKPTFITSSEWKSDTKTPEAGTPKSGNLSEKSDSFQNNRSKLQNCISKVRKSINKGTLSSNLANIPPMNNLLEKELIQANKSKKDNLIPSAAAASDHFFNDEQSNSAPTIEITSTEISPSSRFRKLKTIISSAKEQLDMNQRRLSESLRRISSDPMSSSDQTNTTMQNDENSSSLSISSILSPFSVATAGITVGAVGTAYLRNQQPQHRSFISAGDMFGAGNIASSLSWIATLIAAGITVSQIKDWIHSSCRADKTILHEEFKKNLQNHKLETKQDMNNIIEECNKLIIKNQEENHVIINHLLEALEETSILLENNNTDNNPTHSPAVILKQAVEKGKHDLTHNHKQNGIQKLPALSKKTKCSSCWCCDSDDE